MTLHRIAVGVGVSGGSPSLLGAVGRRRTPLRVLGVLDVRLDHVAGLQNPEPGDAPAEEVDDVSVGHASRIEVSLDGHDGGHDDRVCDGAADGSDDVVDQELDERVAHGLISASLAVALSG